MKRRIILEQIISGFKNVITKIKNIIDGLKK